MNKQSKHIVQFSEFGDFVTELSSWSALDDIPWPLIVRAETGEITTWAADEFTRTKVGVFVRTIDHKRDTVLSSWIVTGRYQSMYGEAFGSENEKYKEDARNKGTDMLERVTKYFEQHLPFFEVKRGLIEMGDVKLPPGTWKLIENA